MRCLRVCCFCSQDSCRHQRDSCSCLWVSCSDEKTVSDLARTVSDFWKTLTVLVWDSPSHHKDSSSRQHDSSSHHSISCPFAHGTRIRTLLCMWQEMKAKWKGQSALSPFYTSKVEGDGIFSFCKYQENKYSRRQGIHLREYQCFIVTNYMAEAAKSQS